MRRQVHIPPSLGAAFSQAQPHVERLGYHGVIMSWKHGKQLRFLLWRDRPRMLVPFLKAICATDRIVLTESLALGEAKQV
jgi:hypothetical protein